MIALVGLTISAMFLWLAFNRLNPGEVLGYLRDANPLLIGFAALWYFTAVMVISLRWRFLLRPAWAAPKAPPTADALSTPVTLASVDALQTPVASPVMTVTPAEPVVSPPITDALQTPVAPTPITEALQTPVMTVTPTEPSVGDAVPDTLNLSAVAAPVATELTSAPADPISPIDTAPIRTVEPMPMPTAKAPSILHLAGLVSIGYMGNNVFPLRAGEVMRIALLQNDFHIPFARVTTTVLIERALDGIVMVTFILAALTFGGFALAETVRPIAFFATPLFIIALGVFFWFALHPAQLHAFASRIAARLPDRFEARVLHVLDDAIAGLEALRTPLDLLGAVAFSYASWMLEASTYLIVARAFNLPVDYLAMLLVVGVVNLAGLIPASPGQFGVYEFFVKTVLIAIGVAEGAAIAFAFSIHMVIWLPVTLVGFFILWRRGVGWSVLRGARALDARFARESEKEIR